MPVSLASVLNELPVADLRDSSDESIDDPIEGSAPSEAYHESSSQLVNRFAVDVARGLSQSLKSIPSWYLYDAEGSRLFTKITELPEYDLTRNETEILRQYSINLAELMKNEKASWRVVELGAGDGTKTEILLRAMLEVGVPAEYWPIDISPAALDGLCARMQERIPELACRPIVGDNVSGLSQLVSARKDERILILDLGSSIGNRSRQALQETISEVRSYLREGDAAFIGFDLVKDSKLMLAAYDDAAGVTRDFNLNLLTRMNRELGANFDLKKFRHEATWNPEIGGMESWLVSLEDQEVSFSGLNAEPEPQIFRFRKWEPIRTEISLKFNRDEISNLAQTNSYAVWASYTDRTENFTDALLKAEARETGNEGKKKSASCALFTENDQSRSVAVLCL